MRDVKVSAIVPAAGTGRRLRSRLKTSIPKPYLLLGGIPILIRTLAKLEAVPQIKEIIVACEPRYKGHVLRLALKHGITKLRGVVRGGKTRTDSVYLALRTVSPRADYVLIHDGVRPLIHSATIRRLVLKAGRRPAAWVVARPVVPTVKEVRGGAVAGTLDRTGLWEIETPQIFHKKLLQSAYEKYFQKPFPATDDASLVEHLGARVRVFPIRENNLKITTVEDFEMARALFADGDLRTGWGEDRHRLVAGEPLYLGGLRIPSPWGGVGHSDGDVTLHAIVDAILGALGLGDIGEHFPNTDKRYRGIRSERFLRKALALAGRENFEIVNIDTCVVLESPKLGAYKKRIQKKIASMTGLEARCVGIKAKTAEGLGPEGRHEAIAAHAVVTLRRSGN